VHDYDDRYEETKERERQCAESCLAEGGAWDFSGGQCSCHFDGYNYEFEDRAFGDYDYEEKDFGSNEPNYDCALLDCFPGYYCDPFRGCVQDDFGSNEPTYDCSVMFCQEGSYCDPYRGCVQDDYQYPPGPGDPGYEEPQVPYDCSQLDCGGSPNYCDPYQGCVSGDDGFNPDGSSCDEGYEWDGSGCIPFGTGDYGFENNCPEGQYYDSNGICTSGSDDSSSTTDATTTDTTTTSDGTTGAVITGNSFLNYRFR